jgi:hypothetical protein
MAAKNYTEILALVNAGNQMGLSNTIKRDYGIPLDFTSVQPSFDDAVIYAAENTKAYVGQPLSVGGKLYIINDVAAETKYVIGEKEYDNYLVEVGSATEGDGATIDLENGVLTLHGFEGALSGYLPRKAEDGTLEWVPISAVVQGDGNKVTTLTSEDGSVTITKTTDTDASLVYDLSVEKYDDTDVKDRLDAIEEEIGEKAEGETASTGIYKVIDDALQAAKDYADAQDADTIYDDTALSNRVKAIEDDYLKEADKYDDTAIKERVQALETAVGNAEGGLVKDVADNKVAIEANATAIETEKARAEAAEAKALSDAQTYTDEEIAGLEIAIEKEDQVEFIVVRNKDGEKVASVDASRFVQDSFLNDVSYDPATGKVTFTWTMGDGSTKNDEIDISALVDTYTAGTGLKVDNNEFSVDTDVIATVEALNEVRTIAEDAQTAQEVSDAIDAKITEANLGQYAVKTDVETELGKKANASDVVANDTFESFKTENAQAIADARTGAVADVEAKGYAVADEVAQTYATKSDLEDHSNTMATTLNDYAKTADVNAELAKKIETGSISHSSDTLAEGVTVEGTKLNIVVDAYTKQEVRDYVADVIEDMTGGESAADVLLALNNHIATYEEKVGQIDTKNGEQDTAIAAAQAQADKGVADAKTANDAIAALTNGAVATNTADIEAVKGRLTTLETAKGDHETRISAAEGKITSLETATGNNATAIGALQGKDAELVAEDARLAGLIDALGTSKANASDVYTKGEVDTKVQEAINAIPDVDFTPYATNEYVNTELAKKANVGDSYTKAEADGKFMTEGQVDDRLNALINAADPDGGKTITDIQNLVKYVDENAGEIASLITATGNNTAKLAGIETTVVDYVAGQLATIVQPKASAEVTVGEDGTLGLGQVSTDKLVNGVDTLVINGGSAI